MDGSQSSSADFPYIYFENAMFKKIVTAICGLVVSASAVSGAPKPSQLPDDVHKKITLLSKQGDQLAKQERYNEAIKKYDTALALLPEPKTQWEACTWLLVAIGDAHFLDKSYQNAKDAFSSAMHCPDAIGNPFIHLRLGESQFELGNKTLAADELTRAYMSEGKEIFGYENPKYFEFLKTVLKPPANGVW